MATIANRYYMTSDDLIASVKRRISAPDAQSTIKDNEILEFANEEMLLNFIPLVISKHEDYYLIRQEIPLEAGKIRYPIPYRAIGSKMREVAYKRSEDGRLREMFRISVDDVTNSSSYGGTYASRFYLEGESIVLHADEDHSYNGSLVVFYSLRPNSLVSSDRVGVINGLSTDGDNTIIELESYPEDFNTLTQCDFIMTKAPHRVLDYDKSVVEVNEGLRYIKVATEDIPNTLEVGDRITFSGETDIINAPSDLHVMLAQMVASRVLESLGDLQNLQAANQKLKKMEDNTALLVDNRVTGSPTKAKARNGTIRRSGFTRRRTSNGTR